METQRAGGRQRPRPRRGSSLVAALTAALLAAVACAPARATPSAAAPDKPAAAVAAPAASATAAASPPAAASAPTAGPAAQAAPGGAPAAAGDQAVADFYRGKTVRIVVGFAPGGGTDTTARILGRHLGRHIPGNPTVIVENRPGAGGLQATSAIYRSEPKDGTVIGAILENVPLLQVLGDPGVQFDAGRLSWLGSAAREETVCFVRADLGVGSLDDVIAGKEVVIAAGGQGTPGKNAPLILNATLGTHFKVVGGYQSGGEMTLAVERKEVDGWCPGMNTAQSTALAQMLDNGDARVLIFLGDRTPEQRWLEGVPAAEAIARTDEAKTLLRAVNAPNLMSKPYVAAPEVPAARAQALRKAIADAFADPQLQADAQKSNLPLAPSTGEEVTERVRSVLDTPPDLREKLKSILLSE